MELGEDDAMSRAESDTKSKSLDEAPLQSVREPDTAANDDESTGLHGGAGSALAPYGGWMARTPGWRPPPNPALAATPDGRRRPRDCR